MYQGYSPIVRPPLAAKSYRNKNTQQFFSEVLSYGRKDVWRFFSRETFWYTGLLVAAIKRCGFFVLACQSQALQNFFCYGLCCAERTQCNYKQIENAFLQDKK